MCRWPNQWIYRSRHIRLVQKLIKALIKKLEFWSVLIINTVYKPTSFWETLGTRLYTNLRKTTHQIQFPKPCKTVRSKSCQLPFATSVQRIQSFGSIFLLQITFEGTNDTINISFLPPSWILTTNSSATERPFRHYLSSERWPCVNRSPWWNHHNLIPEL